MFSILKSSISKCTAATFLLRSPKKRRLICQPLSSPPQLLLLSESTLLNNLFLLLSSKYQLKLLLTVTTSDGFCLIHVIKLVPGFFWSLSAKDTLPDRCPAHEIRPLRHRPLAINSTYAKNMLVADFAQKKEAATSFSPLLIDTSTHDAIRQFQSHIDNVIASTNDICACCDLFILFGAYTMLTRIHPDFISTIKTAVIVQDHLDYFKHVDAGFHFRKSCYKMVIEKKITKFRSANCINVSRYQKYPNIFNDLTAVEEAVSACTHPIMFIIKLRYSGSGFPTLYHCI